MASGDSKFNNKSKGESILTYIGKSAFVKKSGQKLRIRYLNQIVPKCAYFALDLNFRTKFKVNVTDEYTLFKGHNFDYTDLKATATDPEDGDLTGKIAFSGVVNTGKVGDYTVKLTVTDKGGKTATKKHYNREKLECYSYIIRTQKRISRL